MRIWVCLGLVPVAIMSSCAEEVRAPQFDKCTTIVDSSPAATGGLSPTTTTLSLMGISPVAGATLNAESTLAADLEFSIRDFQPDQFEVMAQFDTIDRQGWTTDGTFKDYPVLASAAGKIHFCFPMSYVWTDRTVRRPFSVRFYLQRITGPYSTTGVAQTETFQYQADR
jgi:hypothetical protein